MTGHNSAIFASKPRWRCLCSPADSWRNHWHDPWTGVPDADQHTHSSNPSPPVDSWSDVIVSVWAWTRVSKMPIADLRGSHKARSTPRMFLYNLLPSLVSLASVNMRWVIWLVMELGEVEEMGGVLNWMVRNYFLLGQNPTLSFGNFWKVRAVQNLDSLFSAFLPMDSRKRSFRLV